MGNHVCGQFLLVYGMPNQAWFLNISLDLALDFL